jgi:O-antigen/teichoic acid export membrane protein
MLWRHGLIYLVAQGVPALINLGAISVYSRLLEVDEYGRYVFIIASVGLGNKLLFEWLRLALLRFLPGYAGREDVLRSTLAVAFAGLIALIALAGGLGAALIASPDLRALWAAGVALLAAQTLFDLHLTLARSRLRPAVYGLMAVSKSALALLFGAALASLGWGAAGLILGLTLGLAIVVAPALRRELPGLRPTLCDWRLMQDLAWYGGPLAVTAASGFLLDSSDRYLIAWLLGDGPLGRYGAAYDLASFSIGVLLMIVNLAAYPLVMNAFERGGLEGARPDLANNLTALLGIGLPATLGMFLLAEPIANLLLGEPFRADAIALMPLIAVGALLRDLKAFHLDYAFQLGRRTVGQIWVTLAALIANVVLNLWLIPLFGIAGSAYATIASYALALVLSALLGRRILALPRPNADALKIVGATLTMGLVVWHLRSSGGSALVLAQILLTGVASYGLLILALDVAGIRRRLLAMLGRGAGSG